MANLFTFDPTSEFDTEERCFINELSNSNKDEECSIALARVEPGVTTQVHSLSDTVERYVIIEGTGRIESGSLTGQDVKRFDTVIIPADEPQSITNTGKQDLVFLCVCTGRFQPENYLKLSD